MKWAKNSKGFSLMEVMIAIAILAVSLLAVFNLQSTSLMGSARAQRLSIATQLAQYKMSKTLLEIEQGIVKGEFPDEKEESGTFEEEEQPNLGWTVKIQKADIPAPPTGEGTAAIVAQVFSVVSEQLSKSTREVTLQIFWIGDEEPEQLLSLSTHVVKMQ